ncbi:MAG TPA: ThuA domain-containing protein, partial [Tepidisphaeraceae bacterium]|nr:ThuA domain-containing protein [Tepidisphaeraceae bacterium]
NLATNAGGTQVLRYGNARDLCLGLEVVTAQGDVWHGLSGLRKDNTGYDLKQLVLGSEDTLGIVTAATLKLFPAPSQVETAFRDFARFTDDGLAQVGAIVFLSTTGELPMSEPQRQAMLRYIEQGGGFVGIHSATDTFYGWAEYGEMIGAYFDGHPWNAGDTITLKIDDPDHPAAKPWINAERTFKEEIYQFRRPYDRAKLHVLLSLDVEKTDMRKSGIKRRDGDFALAWTKPHGQGRVFYTALGHNESVWKMPAFRAHLRAGIEQVLKR